VAGLVDVERLAVAAPALRPGAVEAVQVERVDSGVVFGPSFG
jgi:hypothetical protein